MHWKMANMNNYKQDFNELLEDCAAVEDLSFNDDSVVIHFDNGLSLKINYTALLKEEVEVWNGIIRKLL